MRTMSTRTTNRKRLLGMIACITVIGLQMPAAWGGEGREGGNGGGVVVCRDPAGQVQSVEFYDIYEARELRGITPSLGNPHWSPEEKLHRRLTEFARLSPIRAQLYQNLVGSFRSEAKFLKGKALGEIADAGPAIVPDGCKIEQLIIYREPVFPEDGPQRYLVNRDLWDRMDNDNQAAAMLHEAIYRELSTLPKHTDSVASRYYNSYLFSGKILSLSYPEFVQLHVRARTGYVDINGVLAQLNPVDVAYSAYNFTSRPLQPSFRPDGSLETAHLINWEYVKQTNFSQDWICETVPNPAACYRKALAHAGPLGLPEYSYIAHDGKKLAVKGYVTPITNEVGWFSPTGKLDIFNVSRFQGIYADITGREYFLPVNAKSEINLLSCSGSYGSASVTMGPNGWVRTFESNPCSMSPQSPIQIVIPPPSGADYLLTIKANDTYPCSSIFLDIIGGVLDMAKITGECLANPKVTRRGTVVAEAPEIRYDPVADQFRQYPGDPH